MSTSIDQLTPAVLPTVATPKRRGLSLGSILLIAAIIISGLIIALALNRQRAEQPTSGPAPDFAVTTFDGESFRLSDLRGQVVVVNFWASWCGPCRQEAPELEAAWQAYRDSGDVVFLGIAYADNGPRSLEFMAEYGITYPNAPDLGTRISEAYNIRGVPETFIVDREGNIAQFIYAGVTRQTLSAIIDRALAGEAAS